MTTVVKLIPAIISLFIMGWFISFQFNPYNWCDDHPDPEKTQTHYICEPFGFDLEKGSWLERSPDHQFAGEDKVIHLKKEKILKKKTFNCKDPNVLMTSDGYDYCLGKNK